MCRSNMVNNKLLSDIIKSFEIDVSIFGEFSDFLEIFETRISFFYIWRAKAPKGICRSVRIYTGSNVNR